MLRNTLLAALAVLTTANLALAGVMVDVTENGSPGAGFRSFMVRLVGTDGENVGSVVGLNLTGVHQVWENPAGNGDTPRRGDTEGTFGNAAWRPFDTHVLMVPPANTSPGFGISETNDGTNPGGISLAPGNPAFAAFPGTAGKGNLTFTGDQPTMAFLAPQPATVDLLQVVLREGDAAHLTAQLVGSNATGFIDVDQMIGMGVENLRPVGGSTTIDDILAGQVINTTFPATDPESDPITFADLAISYTPGFGGAGTPGAVTGGTLGTDGSFEFNTLGRPRGVYTATATPSDAGGAGSSSTLILNVTAVPEPSTVALCGLAMVGLVGLIRRRG